MMRGIVSFVMLVSLGFGQSQLYGLGQADSSKYLLNDFALQLEITDAVDQMYNFNFHKAEVEFNWLRYNHPNHPLPYFLYGISTWWQMMPNLEKESPLGEEFLAYMDTAIVKAEALLEVDEDNVEAEFFLAGSYGFKGRYHSEKKNWGRAAGAGRLALKYLKLTRGDEGFSPEVLFGDALFNYYSIWIRENYPMLKPVLLFFPKGDKELGIKQMEEVAANAFYTRVEAIYFLMRIKAFETKDTSEALRLATYVHEQYPDNPYFHRFYTRMLYTTGQHVKTEEESLKILQYLDSGKTGYEEISGRYASFFLGHLNRARGNWQEAERYYLQTLDYSKEVDMEDGGYSLFAALHLAQYYVENGRYDEATPLLDLIRDNTRRRESANKEARELQKEIKQNRKRK